MSVRRCIAGAALVAASLVPLPASANGVGVAAMTFTGSTEITCFGCGVSTGYGTMCASGQLGTTSLSCVPHVNAPNYEVFYDAYEDGGIGCLITGAATGVIWGEINMDFTWTRVGATGVMTVSSWVVDGVNGAGVAEFHVTNAGPIPCGVPLTAEWFGVITGVANTDDEYASGIGQTSYNNGETASVVLTSDLDLSTRAAVTDAHDLQAGCLVRVARQTGTMTVTGRAHAGRHPAATATLIRCQVVVQRTGAVVFDESRTESGSHARFEFVLGAGRDKVAVCVYGQGWWADGHGVALGFSCQAV